MCYSALIKRKLDELSQRFHAVPVREDWKVYTQASAIDPKRFPPLADRIYPGHYAPVIVQDGQERRIELMRYGAYPPHFVREPKRYTSYNARRDNLSSAFWGEAFRQHHGAVLLAAFYEWVSVADLLRAGVVTLGEIKAEFARQAEERRDRLAAEGKPYKPTPTEQKDARFRKIIIEFKPQAGAELLLVPVIFSFGRGGLAGKMPEKGFAIVTDDPPADIARAGHDRCPVLMAEPNLSAWLTPAGQSLQALNQLLEQRVSMGFQHRLPPAA